MIMLKFINNLWKKFWSFQFNRFLLIGTLNTISDFSIVNFLAFIFNAYRGINLLAINTFSFVTVVTFSFFMNKRLTFQGAGEMRFAIKKQYFMFFTITLIGLFLNNTIVYLITTIIGPQFGLNKVIWLNFSKAMAVSVVLFWDFFNYKYLVFKK